MKGLDDMVPYETTKTDIEALKDLMYDEACDSKYYADLIRYRWAYDSSASLKRISDEEAAHLKKLQAEFYILTGSTYFPCVALLDIPDNFLEALRKRFLDENKVALAYRDAAAQTLNPRLSKIYTEISDDELRHAEDMANLISDYILSI